MCIFSCAIFLGVRVKAVGPIFAINTIDTRMYPEIDILLDVADARSQDFLEQLNKFSECFRKVQNSTLLFLNVSEGR